MKPVQGEGRCNVGERVVPWSCSCTLTEINNVEKVIVGRFPGDEEHSEEEELP